MDSRLKPGTKTAFFKRVGLCYETTVSFDLSECYYQNVYLELDRVKIYREEGNRTEAFQQLLCDAKTGVFSLLITESESVLGGRNLLEAIHRVHQLNDAGVMLFLEVEQLLLQNEDGIAILSLLAEQETVFKSQRRAPHKPYSHIESE